MNEFMKYPFESLCTPENPKKGSIKDQIDEMILTACKEDSEAKKYLKVFELFKSHGLSIIDGMELLTEIMNAMGEGNKDDG